LARLILGGRATGRDSPSVLLVAVAAGGRADVVAVVAILGNGSVFDVYVGLMGVATPQARSSLRAGRGGCNPTP
jgi:hypothetical protein